MTFSPRQMVAAPAVRRMPAPPRNYDLADPYAGTMAARDTSVAWMTFMGIPQEGVGVDTYDRLSDYAKAPADVGWVMACVTRIFNAYAGTPLRVYVKQGKELIPADDSPTPASEDLQYLLDNVNPVDMTGSELRGYIASSRKIWGGWYLKKVKGRLLHDTQELYFLRVPDVTPKSQDGRTIDYYEYRPHAPAMASQAEQIMPGDMIRHRGLNLQSQIEMISPLSAARYDMVTDNAASMRSASILRRMGLPLGYWSAQKGVELNAQDKGAIRRWLRQLTGPRNAGRSLVAPDIDWKSIDVPEKDAQWLQARKVSRMTVSAILGVPLALAGDDEHAGFYRSVRDAQGVFWRDTAIPEGNGDCDTLNNWLVPEFNRPGDPKLVVAYDFSTIESIKPVWQEEWTGWLSALEHQVITPNRFIDHFRLGDHVPWGDRPVPRTMISYRPTDPGTTDLSQVLPFMEPDAVAAGDVDVETIPDGSEAETLRAFGRGLYQHPAVRAFIAGGELNVTYLMGRPVPEPVRMVIEDGLRSRQTAGQIADRIAVRKGDVVEAVLAGLRKQWPESDLEIVREGEWTFDPKFPLDKINAAKRPIARNPKIVAGVEAMFAVGAPIAPITLIHTKVIGKGGYEPIDGWHRELAAVHQGLKTIPAYVGEGDADWTTKLIAMDDEIPTPPDDAGQAVKSAQERERLVSALERLGAPVVVPAPVVNVPAPIVNVPAPIVNVTTPEPKPTVTVKEVVRDEAGNMVRVVEATK